MRWLFLGGFWPLLIKNCGLVMSFAKSGSGLIQNHHAKLSLSKLVIQLVGFECKYIFASYQISFKVCSSYTILEIHSPHRSHFEIRLFFVVILKSWIWTSVCFGHAQFNKIYKNEKLSHVKCSQFLFLSFERK